jgi:branched-chain amino acid transport system substrate-binding protein
VRHTVALVLSAVALALAGCGSAVKPGQRIPGHTLTIYFSGPQTGASSVAAIAALGGARMALADDHDRMGKYRIVLKALDDSTATSDGWDPDKTTLNTRLVVQDPTAVGYLGDFNSGASAISIPLLNRAGIAQISSGSTAVGLTSTGPGAAPGEPQKYYPAGTRTFARVVPTDASQALALLAIQRTVGCQKTFVLHDGEFDGFDAALSYVQSAGLRVAGTLPFTRQAPTYTSLVKTVASYGVDCVLISAIDERSSVLLTKELASAMPTATIFVGNGLANSAYLDAIPRSLDPRLIVLSATLPPKSYAPAARGFLARYARRFGVVEPSAILGYGAMQLMLDVIDDATSGGRKQADRAKVVAALFDGDQRRTVLGMLHITRTGDLTVPRFGVYRVAGGRLSFIQATG